MERRKRGNKRCFPDRTELNEILKNSRQILLPVSSRDQRYPDKIIVVPQPPNTPKTLLVT
ncbi:hypothetical protein J6590_077252 [Homalodisca vitripennis]|nr:hypothetical protein J6590_077252 [Homalodisca vitripennis]